jgi:hypothetical protein
MIYEKIYEKLDKLIPLGVSNLKEGEGFTKLKSGGFMELSIEFLHYDHPKGKQEGCFIIAMAHNYSQNGDLMADPDMEIAIYPEMKMAEALTYQQDSLGIFQRVYPEPGFVDVRAKKELNLFLNQWLGNLKKQGFYH